MTIVNQFDVLRQVNGRKTYLRGAFPIPSTKEETI
jgi:hypothetical protein